MKINPQISKWLSIILPVMGVVVPVYLHVLDQTKKELTYEVLGDWSLAEAIKPLAPTVENDIHVVTYRFKNTGNTPIAAADFESPIQITFPAASNVLRVTIGDPSPASVRPVPEIEGKTARIKPLLLNPADSFMAQVATIGKTDGKTVMARIAGVKDVSLAAKKTPSIPVLVLVLAFLSVAATLYGSCFLFANLNSDLQPYGDGQVLLQNPWRNMVFILGFTSASLLLALQMFWLLPVICPMPQGTKWLVLGLWVFAWTLLVLALQFQRKARGKTPTTPPTVQ